jgi:lipopolysaccharide exporter
MSTTRTAAKGAAWSIASGVLSRGIGLIGTLVLIRFVSPGDFGEVSAAVAVVMTINQFTTLGVGMYAIAHRDITREEFFHASFIHLALGLLAFVVLTALGKPLGPLFDTPNLASYVPGLAAAALIDRFGYMPERVLIRNLKFRRVSLVRSLSELTFTVVSVGAGWLGGGGMAIVFGNLARSSLRMLGMVISVNIADWLQVHRLRLAVLRKISGYGLTMSLGGVAYTAGRRWDNLLVSRLFGPAVMGAYNLAYNLADIPAIQVGEQITDVMQASFAHMEPEERKRTLVRSLSVIGLVTFPIAIGLGAIAPTLAELFLNKKWAGTGEMLMILSALSVVRPMFGAISSYLLIERGPKVLLVLEWLTLGALMAAIATIGRPSPLWACGAVGLVFTLRTFAGLYIAKATTGVGVTTFVLRFLPPLVACVPMVAAVFGVRMLMHRLGIHSPVLRLGAEVIAGGVTFIGAALVLSRDAVNQLLGLIRRRKKAPVTATAPVAVAAAVATED